MTFRLIYNGPLGSNKGPAEKHAIRRALHPQLVELRRHPPFNCKSTAIPKDARAVGNFHFTSLVNGVTVGANLHVLFLRPEVPGRVILQGGDIDNRIKTLLDALCIPPENQVSGLSPQEGETPFCCVLNDDSSVLAINIETDRLLSVPSDHNPTHVFLVIAVSTRALPTALYPSILHFP